MEEPEVEKYPVTEYKSKTVGEGSLPRFTFRKELGTGVDLSGTGCKSKYKSCKGN